MGKPWGKSRRTTDRKRKCGRAGKDEKSQRMGLWDNKQIGKGVGDRVGSPAAVPVTGISKTLLQTLGGESDQ